MAEAAIESLPSAGVWYKIRSFFNANLVNIFAGSLFALLAIFLLYPIISVLLKSLWGDDGFTFDFYIEFFSYNFYYWSLLNTLILGFATMIILLIVGFCCAYLTTRGPVWLRKPLKIAALLPLAAPPYIFSISLITLFGRNGLINNLLNLDFNIYSWTGVITAQCLAFLPLSFMMIENVLNSLNPSLEETASDMGASEVRIVRSITVPSGSPRPIKSRPVGLCDDHRRVRQPGDSGRPYAISGGGHLFGDYGRRRLQYGQCAFHGFDCTLCPDIYSA